MTTKPALKDILRGILYRKEEEREIPLEECIEVHTPRKEQKDKTYSDKETQQTLKTNERRKEIPMAQQNRKTPSKFIDNSKPFSTITLNINGLNSQPKNAD